MKTRLRKVFFESLRVFLLTNLPFFFSPSDSVLLTVLLYCQEVPQFWVDAGCGVLKGNEVYRRFGGETYEAGTWCSYPVSSRSTGKKGWGEERLKVIVVY